jgi:hypothetical protein
MVVVILLSPAYFPIFPSSHSASLFARMVDMIMFASEKLFSFRGIKQWAERGSL